MSRLTLDCNEICACRDGNRLQLGTPYVVDHYRGRTVANFSDSSQCFLGEMLPPAVNASGINVTSLMNSYLSPPVIIITMVTNVFVCIVLTRKNMVSPTNVLLLAMAFVDMVTGLLPLPWYLLIAYARRIVVNQMCTNHYVANLLDLMVTTMPTICHTISIWLTVMLAAQRWIYISYPTSVKRICSVQKSVTAVTVLSLVTVAFFSVTQLLLSGSIYFRMRPMAGGQGTAAGRDAAVVSCSIQEHRSYYMGAMIVRALLVNIVPCLLLILITALLIRGLHRASRRRQQLLRNNHRAPSAPDASSIATTAGAPSVGGCRRIASTKKRRDKAGTTLMLTIIVGIFLLVELPMTLIMTVFVLMLAGLVGDSVWELVNHSFPFVNFIILVSYPVNFFIYCLMSTQFRQTFASLFSGAASANRPQPSERLLPGPSGIECSSRADLDTEYRSGAGGGGGSVYWRRRSSVRLGDARSGAEGIALTSCKGAATLQVPA